MKIKRSIRSFCFCLALSVTSFSAQAVSFSFFKSLALSALFFGQMSGAHTFETLYENAKEASRACIGFNNEQVPILSISFSNDLELERTFCEGSPCDSSDFSEKDSKNSNTWSPSMQSSPLNNTMYSPSLTKHGKAVHIDILKYISGVSSSSNIHIDTLEGRDWYPSLQLNHKGNPVFSYSDIEKGLLKIAVCEDINCTTLKNTTFIIDMMDMAWHPALGINKDNHPVLSYFNSREGNASIIICDNPTCTGYTTHTIDTGGSVGFYADLQFTKDNHPVIGFYDYQNGDVKLIICDTPTCSSHIVQTIDTVGNVHSSMFFPPLQRNENGHLVMAYFDAENKDLKLAVCGDTLCTNPTINTVASPESVGWCLLQLDKEGHPVIAFHEWSERKIKRINCDDEFCSTPTVSFASLSVRESVATAGSIVVGCAIGYSIFSILKKCFQKYYCNTDKSKESQEGILNQNQMRKGPSINTVNTEAVTT